MDANMPLALPRLGTFLTPAAFDFEACTPTGTPLLNPRMDAFTTASPVDKRVKREPAKDAFALAFAPRAALALPSMDDEAETTVDMPMDVATADEAKLRLSRERNRLHAQRTRIRKRELLESLKACIRALQQEHRLLRQSYEAHVTAVYLLSLGDAKARRGVDAVLEENEEEGAVQAEEEEDAVDELRVVAVNDEDVDAVAAATYAPLHEAQCPCALGDGGENEMCSCVDVTMTTSAGKEEGKDTREQIRRERNRLHARRARLRKKLLLEKSQKVVHDLRLRNEALRAKLSGLVASIYDGREPVWCWPQMTAGIEA